MDSVYGKDREVVEWLYFLFYLRWGLIMLEKGIEIVIIFVLFWVSFGEDRKDGEIGIVFLLF